MCPFGENAECRVHACVVAVCVRLNSANAYGGCESVCMSEHAKKKKEMCVLACVLLILSACR